MLVRLSSGEFPCEVIKLSADDVLLNPNSHRIRSQLQGDPEWEKVSADPFSESAQRIVQALVRSARPEIAFNDLKQSLRTEGQSDPGVITHDGVLVNANTRAVAMRELEKPEQRVIRVAVLPSTVQPEEIGLLELRLQMQKEFKAEYSLTNELLFIEELSNERHMTAAAIADELRYSPGNPKKGAQEVESRLKYLDLLRLLQKIPTTPLRLRDLDSLSLQQMKEAQSTYTAYMDRSPGEARRYLENFLLSVLSGITAVHLIREVDADFVREHVVPALEDEDDLVPQQTAVLATPTQRKSAPRGASTLAGGSSIEDSTAPNVVGLIDAITSKDRSIKVPGSSFTLERSDVKASISSAVLAGIKDKKRARRDANKIEAPVTAVKDAMRATANARDALGAAVSDPEFDAAHRKSLEAAFKKLKRSLGSLETALSNAKVLNP